MKIFIGSDHAGFEFKEKMKAYLTGLGHVVEDQGAHSFDVNDDYPDFVKSVAEEVAKDQKSKGIVVGGSGFGEAMCANRVLGARAIVFYGPMFPKGAVDAGGRTSSDPYEIIKLGRLHNDANIISFGARFVTEEESQEAIKAFLNTEFSGEERHARRIKKLG